MKALTKQLQSMLVKQPYEKPKRFSSEGVLELNDGCTVTYVATEKLLRLRANAINHDVPLPPTLNNLNLSLSTGVLINNELLVVNLVCMKETDNNCVITYDATDGSARAEWFTGQNAVVLVDDKYLSNEKLDVAIVYLEGGHVPSGGNETPTITCIPTTRNFIDNPVNYDLVSTVDVRYQFYAIVESEGQRYFVRARDRAVPTENIGGGIYYDDEMVDMDLTAALSVNVFLTPAYISTKGFNEEYRLMEPTNPYRQIIEQIWFRYDVKQVMTPGERDTLTVLNGYTTTSTIPPDFAGDNAEGLGLRLYAEPFSIKFVHASNDEIQRYGIVNNGSQRCINIIDYMNNANELVTLSCARIGLLTDPNIDDVSLINCAGAPTEYSFGLQLTDNLFDFSGTLQITDTVTGLAKKYKFDSIYSFLTSYVVIDTINLDFPTYNSGGFSGDDKWVIHADSSDRDPDNRHPLKIIIQMNASNALFTNNGTNRIAFCLNVSSGADK